MALLRKTKEEKAKAATHIKAQELKAQAAELSAAAKALSGSARAGLSEGAVELSDKATELAERVRKSDAYGRAWERGGDLASTARGKLADAGVDAKAAELLEILRDSDSVAEAKERSKVLSGSALASLGAWLGSGQVGKQLGVQKRRRRWPAWVLGFMGVGAGYAIGVLTAPKRGDELRDDWAAASAAAASSVSSVPPATATSNSGDTADLSMPVSEKPLADRIRTRLGEDPRTSDLPKLNVNVVEGTVFVRGSVSSDVDTDAIKGVISDIDGVKDVDLQLTTT